LDTVSFLVAACASLSAQNNCQFQTIAGPSALGDGGPANMAFLSAPQGLATDIAGTLYIADTQNHRIRKVSTDGTIVTIAGNGIPGSGGDGGMAVDASLNAPQGVIVGPDGAVYIADTANNRIRRVAADGTVTAFAGTGHPGFSGDSGPALSAEFYGPTAMAFDTNGALYVADTNNNRVRKIDSQGIVTTVAGTRNASNLFFPCCAKDDGGPAAGAHLLRPRGVAVARDGTVYIADTGNQVVRRVSPTGIITTVAGTIGQPNSFTYPAPSTQSFFAPSSLLLGDDGSLYIGDGYLVRLTADGKMEIAVSTYGGVALASDQKGGFYTISLGSSDIVTHVPSSGPATTYAGQFHFGTGPDGASAFGAVLHTPMSMAIGSDHSLYVADFFNARVIRLSGGVVHAAGKFQGPIGISIDASDNLYVADYSAGLLRRLGADGSVSTVAGGGIANLPLPGSPEVPATSVNLTNLYRIMGVVAHPNGNIFAAVFKQNPSSGLLLLITPQGGLRAVFNTQIAGGSASSGFDGLGIDSAGNVLFPVDQGSGSILRFDGTGKQVGSAPTGRYSTVAGGPSGAVYVVNIKGQIQRITADNIATTIFNRDLDQYEGVASQTTLNSNMALALDSQGNLFVADRDLNRIRELPAGSCTIVPQPKATNVLSTPSPTTNTIGFTTFAPGELISIYGSGLGPNNAIATTPGTEGLYPFAVSGVRVLFEGVPGPILYASGAQLNVVIPFGMYGYSTVRAQVEYDGVLSDAYPLIMSSTAPAVFTYATGGAIQPIIVNPDLSLNSRDNPAPAGSYVTFYMTGLGVTSPLGTDGNPASFPLPTPVEPVSVDADGFSILYAGDAPGLVEGVSQVNVQLPKAPVSTTVPFKFGDLTISLYIASK
jgi:uncharacterized protein (TIGR03437 family)